MRDFVDRFCRYRQNLHVEHFKAAISDRRDAVAVWKFIQQTKDCLTSLDMYVKALTLTHPVTSLNERARFLDHIPV
jgi:hypothetical protein